MVATDSAVSTDLVESIVSQVWESMFAVPVVVVDVEADDAPAAGDWTAAVDVSGAWDGTVSLTCAAGIAESMTRRMLSLTDAETVDPLDVEDALGELVNVVGGNVKSLFDGCSLGLPHVSPALPWATPPLAVLGVDWEGSIVRIAVHTKEQS